MDDSPAFQHTRVLTPIYPRRTDSLKLGGEHAGGVGPRRCWPDAERVEMEDCRHVSIRLERAFLAAGERVVRAPPKLMTSPTREMRWRSLGRRAAGAESARR